MAFDDGLKFGRLPAAAHSAALLGLGISGGVADDCFSSEYKDWMDFAADADLCREQLCTHRVTRVLRSMRDWAVWPPQQMTVISSRQTERDSVIFGASWGSILPVETEVC